MIEDANAIPAGAELECDVAIVGSGAAGATLACELIESGLNVLVLEGGGEKFDAQAQELYKGEVDDKGRHGELTRYRRRMFGGTTTVWGGRCAPFDPIDFEARPWVPHSGWPVTRAEMDPYYERAHAYAHAGNYTYEAASLPDGTKPLVPGLDSKVVLQDRMWRFSLPTDFGKTNRARIKEASNVRLLLHANVLQLKSNATGARVEKLRVATLEGKEFTVRARFIALAAGGIEVTRLLLLSNDANPAGLGNEHDLVGRFYGSHVSGDLGEVALTPSAAGAIWTYEQGRDGVYCKRYLRISEETQRRVGLLNYRCTLTHPPFGDPSHRSAVLSAAYLVKRFLTHQIPPEFSKDMASREYHHVRQHMRNVILGSPSLVGFGLHWFFKRTIATRKYPSVSLRSKANRYTIHFDAEQAPNRESRIILGDDTDRFGLRRVRVLWKTSDLDSHSVGECHRILAEEFERTGTGKVELPHTEAARIIRDESGVGSHHIGSTRMADDPRQGVVDRNARVHSVENLFIAAPSIFCTASFANPVLTTAAFAVRLGDHIKATCR
ncbi:MAG: hypothetical protein RL088_2815 [Verrucomicrobiota bacterium]